LSEHDKNFFKNVCALSQNTGRYNRYSEYREDNDANIIHNTDKDGNLIFFNSMEEVATHILKSKKRGMLFYSDDFDTLQKICNKVFKQSIEKIPHKMFGTGSQQITIGFISDVFEKRIDDVNYRFACMVRPSRFGSTAAYKICSEDDREYLYLDKGRMYAVVRGEHYFFDLQSTEYTDSGKILFYGNLIKRIGILVDEILRTGEYVIPHNVYEFYKKRVNLNVDDEEEDKEEDKEDIKYNIILNKYMKVIREGRIVRTNGIEFSKNHIKIIDENFCIKFCDNFLDMQEKEIVKSILKATKDTAIRYNFNLFYNTIIGKSILKCFKRTSMSHYQYSSFGSTRFIVNDMQIDIVKTNRLYINGVFVRLDDVMFLLQKAICFEDVDEFTEYLHDVSAIGADWTKLISDGVVVRLDNPLLEINQALGKDTATEDVLMRFSFNWDVKRKSYVYLSVNNTKYLIKQKMKFKKYFERPNMKTSMAGLQTILLSTVEGLDEDSVIELAENAIEEAKIVKEKGMRFVNDTVKDIKAKHTQIEIHNTKINGYTLKGVRTGAEYFIADETLTVYRKQNGSWNMRCVVDDTRKQRIYEDRLANRLINIYNEPAYIHTL
jgi:hypothetical protein